MNIMPSDMTTSGGEVKPIAPAYVLTLQHHDSPALWTLLRSLSEAGLDPHIVDGTNGGALSAREYFLLVANCRARYGYWLTPGEVGCTLGHMSIYRALIASGEDIAFVFEDDVDLARLPDVSSQIRGAMTAGDIHFLHLGGQDGIECRKSLYGRPCRFHAEMFELENGSLSFLNRTCAYAITRAAAQNMLESLENSLFKIDDFGVVAKLMPERKVHFWNVVAHPIDLGGSCIEAERRQLDGPHAAASPLLKRIFDEVLKTYSFRRTQAQVSRHRSRNGYVPLFS